MVPWAAREVLSRRYRRVSFYFVQSGDGNADAACPITQPNGRTSAGVPLDSRRANDQSLTANISSEVT